MEQYKAKIQECEQVLGYSLTPGEMSDLLLDNFDEIPGCDESHEIVSTILGYNPWSQAKVRRILEHEVLQPTNHATERP